MNNNIPNFVKLYIIYYFISHNTFDLPDIRQHVKQKIYKRSKIIKVTKLWKKGVVLQQVSDHDIMTFTHGELKNI